jgi:hypothetical protein
MLLNDGLKSCLSNITSCLESPERWQRCEKLASWYIKTPLEIRMMIFSSQDQFSESVKLKGNQKVKSLCGKIIEL